MIRYNLSGIGIKYSEIVHIEGNLYLTLISSLISLENVGERERIL